MTKKEAAARIKINKALEAAGWRLPDGERPNVEVEFGAGGKGGGFADYALLDKGGYPLIILEAKSADKGPLVGKEQARRYAKEQGAPFVILSNGENHFFWDIAKGNPEGIDVFPSPEEMAKQQERPAADAITGVEVGADYVAETQQADKRILRDYQVRAVQTVQKAAGMGKRSFLLEMATGTGKTLVAAALIKLFVRTGNANRVLFLVDRLELEQQAHESLGKNLPDYRCAVYKRSKNDWRSAEVVVSTVQSISYNERLQNYFRPMDFNLVIVDEAHRCIAGRHSREVFKYFPGYKIGLTATPHDFLKGADDEKVGSKAMAARHLRDTYETFECPPGEPTFRYNLEDGVKDGHLLRPKVLDARTEMTTQLLSEKGLDVVVYDDDGNPAEERIFERGDFERTLYSEGTNESCCRVFMDNARCDPISDEIGKTIVYCVNQKHAEKVTNILNRMAMDRFPGKYQSDFAVQVTSNQEGAQEFSRQFAGNMLHGTTGFREDYDSSKTRVCVTVEMMTTGYDCTDLLNLCFMRPVFSPSLFVQMKGRGTRLHKFTHNLGRGNMVEIPKEGFTIFDFFAVCEYFEKDFDYNAKLELPSGDSGDGDGERPPISAVILTNPDPVASIVATDNAMFRVDQPGLEKVVQTITQDAIIRRAVAEEDWSVVKAQAREHELGDDTLKKIAADNELDRLVQIREVVEYAFGIIKKFKTRPELLIEEGRRFAASVNLPEEEMMGAIYALKAYIDDREVRQMIDDKDPGGLMYNEILHKDAWDALSEETQEIIIRYANSQIALHVFDVDMQDAA